MAQVSWRLPTANPDSTCWKSLLAQEAFKLNPQLGRNILLIHVGSGRDCRIRFVPLRRGLRAAERTLIEGDRYLGSLMLVDEAELVSRLEVLGWGTKTHHLNLPRDSCAAIHLAKRYMHLVLLSQTGVQAHQTFPYAINDNAHVGHRVGRQRAFTRPTQGSRRTF